MKSHLSLLDWFLQNKQNSEVTGYTNHMWNGVTTLSFAKICDGIFKNDVALPHVQHIIPNGKCTKFELLKMFAEFFGRGDILIKPCSASSALDRSLTSTNPELNSKLWEVSGYKTPPTLREMLSELAAFRYSFQ
jgi:dTDP-4-dehydrorhamnose reductase